MVTIFLVAIRATSDRGNKGLLDRFQKIAACQPCRYTDPTGTCE